MSQFIIDELNLNNFKSYSNNTKIKFGSRITLLFGKGSVGKSTIIDAIQLLHSSANNNTDIHEKDSKYILSKNSKINEFSIGFRCSEVSTKDKKILTTRSFLKEFGLEKDEFFTKSMCLYSDLDDSKNKFIEISNKKIPSKILSERIIKDYCISDIKFIENKFAWKELYDAFIKYKEDLKNNLKEIKEFAKKWEKVHKLYKKAHSKGKVAEAEKLERKRLNLFRNSRKDSGFDPANFAFSLERIKIYEDFLNIKKIDFNKFINFVAFDVKISKTYFYKNNTLLDPYDIEEEFGYKLSDKLRGKIHKLFKKNYPSLSPSFQEFLCTSLTYLSLLNEYQKDKSLPPPQRYVSKNSFKWSYESSGKTLTPDAMFRLCNEHFSSTLKKIKTIRHQENWQNIIRSLNQYSFSSSIIQSDFHDIVEARQLDINKWLKEFGYDFKILVEKAGLKGEKEIWHKKYNYKIPSDLGGSGAQYLLTYLTLLLDANENIILLEEPEKALHASLQIKLSNLFSDISQKNQLIIETHSENLLLGLQKQIKDKKIKPEEVSVLYVYMENGISKIDELELNEKGGFKSKWRDGFFTEKLDLI